MAHLALSLAVGLPLKLVCHHTSAQRMLAFLQCFDLASVFSSFLFPFFPFFSFNGKVSFANVFDMLVKLP